MLELIHRSPLESRRIEYMEKGRAACTLSDFGELIKAANSDAKQLREEGKQQEASVTQAVANVLFIDALKMRRDGYQGLRVYRTTHVNASGEKVRRLAGEFVSTNGEKFITHISFGRLCEIGGGQDEVERLIFPLDSK